MILDYRKYIASSKNKTSSALQEMIDKCASNGGGTIIIPSGENVLSNPITLQSNISIHIETGASIISTSSLKNLPQKPFIFAENAHNISINGNGIIDGNGKAFILESTPHIYKATTKRHHTIQFVNCKNINLEDFSIYDSPLYSIHIFKSENITIKKLSIFNDLKMPNSDGIDIDSSRNVIVSDCIIESGDDSICLKANSKSSEDYSAAIIIKNCILKSSSCAIKFGSESYTDIRDILISNCIIKNSNRGIGFQLRDSGSFENIIVSDCLIKTTLHHIDWWGKAEPIYITAIPRTPQTSVGTIKNLICKNLICSSENGIYLEGQKSKKIENVYFEDIFLEVKNPNRTRFEYDRRPCTKNEIISSTPSAFKAENVKNLSLNRINIKWTPKQKQKNFLFKNSSIHKSK